MQGRASGILLLSVILATAGCVSAPSAAPPTAPQSAPRANALAPGSRVHVWLPDNVTRFGRHPTWTDAEGGLVVSVVEMTVPEAKMSEVDEGAAEGVRRAFAGEPSRVAIRRGRTSGYEYSGTTKRGVKARHVSLHAGTAAATVVVAYPAGKEAIAKQIADSVELDPEAPLNPEVLHGLALGAHEGWVVWDALSSSIALKRPEVQIPFPKHEPSLSIFVLPAPREEDAVEVAKSLLSDYQIVRGTMTDKELTIDGSPASETNLGPAPMGRVDCRII